MMAESDWCNRQWLRHFQRGGSAGCRDRVGRFDERNLQPARSLCRKLKSPPQA
jgi:hypothetical protein